MKHFRINQGVLMETKVSRKLIKILMFILVGNLLASSSNQDPKKNSESASTKIKIYGDIEFKSQGAIAKST